MQYSQNFTVKSNARRAARKAGVNVNLVAAHGPLPGSSQKLWRFPLPAEAKPAAAKPTKAKSTKRKASKQPTLKLAGGKGRKTKSAAPRNDHRGKLLSMILAAGGAKIGELQTATGLLAHTIRARISELKRSEKLDVKRERLLGQTIYTATRKAAA